MQPVNEETLILFYYGELETREADAVRRQLADDPALAARFEALSAALQAIPEPRAPERDDNYGRRVWARVDAALDEPPASGGFVWPSWLRLRAAGGVLAAGLVAVVAFQLGRHSPPPLPETKVVVPVAEVGGGNHQARLLEASLVNHLDSAHRLLTEVSNSNVAEVDLEAEKDWAKVLLVANRLYRFAAEQAGQHRIAQLLGDMEPVLIELANGAGQVTPNEYRVLRQSISDRDLLFKVRATNMALRPQSAQL